MEQYIPLDALVAEIENRIKKYTLLQQKPEMSDLQEELQNKIDCLNSIKGYIINTLEVKVTDEVKIGETQIYLEDDGGEPPYDGKQWLDLSCTEYEIPKGFKNGDNVEILIRKVQKGE